MAVLINFKICDNDKACSGMAVCPRGVFCWNEKKKTLEVDNEKCINCGLCEKACMVSAIKVAKTKEEFERLKKEIDEDPRSINDLLVERYGATPIDSAMIGSQEELNTKVKEGQRPLIVEINKEDDIMCLLKSIPVREIADRFDKNTRYRKIIIEDDKSDYLNKFELKKFPSLLFFKDSKYIGKIEGYYTDDEKQDLLNKIDEIVNNN